MIYCATVGVTLTTMGPRQRQGNVQ
jgi:hypothetical protein